MTTHGGRGSMVWGGGHAQVTTWLPNVLRPEQWARKHGQRTFRLLGVIAKGSGGKWRLIPDLWSPDGASVDIGIGKELWWLAYTSVDEAAHTRSCS